MLYKRLLEWSMEKKMKASSNTGDLDWQMMQLSERVMFSA